MSKICCGSSETSTRSGTERLHPKRHLVGRQSRLDFRIARFIQAMLIQLADRFDQSTLLIWRDAGRGFHVVDRMAAAAELDTLIAARQEPGGPLPRRDRLWVSPANAGQDNKPRQVFAFTAQSIRHPGTHRGSAADRRSRVHEGVRRIVIDLLGDHRPHDANVVSHLLMPRQKVADRLSRLAILRELCQRTVALQFLALQLCDRLPLRVRRRHRFAVKFGELRLVVKRFQVRWSAGHAQEDDAFDPRRKIGQVVSSTLVHTSRSRQILGQQ